jgi:hypothetical protein
MRPARMRPALGHDWSEDDPQRCLNLGCSAQKTQQTVLRDVLWVSLLGKRFVPAHLAPNWRACHGKPR